MPSPPNPALAFLEPLERLGLPYMVVGAYACIAYGAIRDTLDVDIVLALTIHDAPRFVAAFPLEDFYCPFEETLIEETARRERGHFNLSQHATFFRADVYLSTQDAFTQWAFAHRRRFPLGGVPIWVGRRNMSPFTSWGISGKATATNICATSGSC